MTAHSLSGWPRDKGLRRGKRLRIIFHQQRFVKSKGGQRLLPTKDTKEHEVRAQNPRPVKRGGTEDAEEEKNA
jgi:hypothetical protein